MKKQLYVLGLAALSLLPAKAQDNTASNIPSHTESVANETDSLLNVQFNFSSWPSNAQFVDFLKKYPNVVIDTVPVQSLGELESVIASETNPFYIAHYNPITDDIHLSYLDAKNATVGNYYGRDDRENIISSISILKGKARSVQANMVCCFIHDRKHMLNRHLISLMGLSVPQIVQIQIHDEITAQIEEMLFRRQIFMNTKSITQAQTGVEAGGIRAINGLSCYHDYLKYLKKHKDDLPPNPGSDEMDLIIKVAIRNFKCDILQYEKNIAQLAWWKVIKVHREYIGLDTVPVTKTDSLGYDGKVRAIYQFGSVSVFDICSEYGKWQILKCVKDFYDSKAIHQQVDYLTVGYSETNARADEYLRERGIENCITLDIKRPNILLQKPKIKKDKQR
jgi:hypothetical protein